MTKYTIYAKAKGTNVMFPYSSTNTSSAAMRIAQEIYRNKHIEEVEVTETTTARIYSKQKEG